MSLTLNPGDGRDVPLRLLRPEPLKLPEEPPTRAELYGAMVWRHCDDHTQKILGGVITTPPPPPPSGEDILRAMREFMRATHTVFAAPEVAERLSAYVFDHATAGWWPDEVPRLEES